MIGLLGFAARRLGGVRRFSAALGGLLLVGALNGAQPVSSLHPPKPKAWIDVKGLCILPLAGREAPATREQLVAALTTGWQRALRLPDPSRVVAADGGRYPAINSLRIDLSDGAMAMDTQRKKKSDRLSPNGKPVSRLGIGEFELKGQPLLCREAKLNFDVSASGVRMDLGRDRNGRSFLLLAAAKDGRLSIDVTCDDIERIVLATAKDAAAPYGVSILRTRFTLLMSGDRSLTARLRLDTVFGFVPAGMTFTAHVDIDDAMNAKLSDLRCEGDEILGPLIVGLLRPGLAKYEGKTRPLVSFPSSEIRLRDVKLAVDDSVHLTAMFGSN